MKKVYFFNKCKMEAKDISFLLEKQRKIKKKKKRLAKKQLVKFES